jgi:hypothetical protein
MWLILLTSTLIASVVYILTHERARWYCFSWFLPWLYTHPKVSQFFGIQYKDDLKWTTTRAESKVFFTGIFVKILQYFTGVPFILPEEIRKPFVILQHDFAKGLDMAPYFKEIDGKTLTIKEFEAFLSRSILIETNRVFEMIDKDTENEFLKHITIVRGIIDALTGDVFHGFYLMIRHLWSTIMIFKILNMTTVEKRLFLHIPQLALINNFSKLLVRNLPGPNGQIDIDDLQPYDFLEPLSQFFVAEVNGVLTFVHRHYDHQNTAVNRAFGPKGTFQCPGAQYSIEFIKTVIRLLKTFNINVEGQAHYRIGRFKNIVNKTDIRVTFNRKSDDELRDMYEREAERAHENKIKYAHEIDSDEI